MDRLALNLALFDVVRLDHFRGFESYWRVPASAADARKGKWTRGPGLPFLKAVNEHFPNAMLIAEDLGRITPAVRDLLEKSGLPGMTILQFAFSGEAENLYLPHNHVRNSVCYPGTHDNDTALGWYRNADADTRDGVRRYLGISGEEISWDLIRAALRSVCRLSIVPMQDLLGLDSSARMNTPGSAMGNWQWRYTRGQIDRLETNSAPYLRELLQTYGRAD
jgi:4-alpha-glucanotransferase